jgi:hypothetical protein
LKAVTLKKMSRNKKLSLAFFLFSIFLLNVSAKMRAAEDYRVSIYGEISGLNAPILTGGASADGRPPSHTSHRKTGVDPAGAKINIAYDIRPKEEVVVLDHHEGILGLDCEHVNSFPSNRIILRVANAEVFLNHLPDDALLSIGPGWGCNSSTTNNNKKNEEEDNNDDGFRGLASLEPDGVSLYLRVVDITIGFPSQLGDILIIDVSEISFQDLFHEADISMNRHLDPEDAKKFAAASAAAIHHLTTQQNAINTTNRRLSWKDAYEFVRHDEKSDAASFSPGLTPHARGLRRLHAATRELQGSVSYTNDAQGYTFQPYCVMWVNYCLWGLTYTYDYTVINWNYDLNKATSCLAQGKNVQQCDRSVSSSIQLVGSVVTCSKCYAYLGANLEFKLFFDRRSFHSFKILVYGGAVATMDINVNFPNTVYSTSTTTMLSSRRNVGSITIPAGPVPLKIEFYSTISVEMTATCTTSGRIIGPGFWFENNAQVGRSYSPGTGWVDLTSTSVYMNQRSPVLDIQVNAALKARLLLDIEFNVRLLYTANWPLHFILAPSLYADLAISTRCTSNMITIALYSGLEGKTVIDGPSFTLSTGSYGLGSYTIGPLFDPISSPYFTLLPKTAFACIGCSGCVSRASAPGAVPSPTSTPSPSVTPSQTATRSPSPTNSLPAGVTASNTPSNTPTLSNTPSPSQTSTPAPVCLKSYVTTAWSACSATCGTGIQTRSAVCRDCNNYISLGCTGGAPSVSQSCDSGVTCTAGPITMYSYSSESSSIVKATSTGAGYKVYKLVPQAYLTPVANNIYTYARFATTLQILSGDADLYLYVNNPTNYPPHDGSLCGCTNCNIGGNQPSLYDTSCLSGTATEIFNMDWESAVPADLYLVIAGWATTSLYTLTTVYYYLLKSSIIVTVPNATAILDSSQLFQFTSASKASGFVVFVTPINTASDSDPDIYCNIWNFTQFPTVSSSQISSVEIGADSLIVDDPITFIPSTSYAIMIHNFIAGSYKIELADIYTLQPGVPSQVMTLEVASAAVYFNVKIPPSSDRVNIILTSTAGDADIYVHNKRFRSNGYLAECNCAYKSERDGDDVIHMDWLDPEWSTTLYISVMSWGASATFTVVVLPVFVMGEAEVYRVSTSFTSSTLLLSGEGRTAMSSYTNTGHHIGDGADCELFGECQAITLPSSMTSCSYGRRLEKEKETTRTTPLLPANHKDVKENIPNKTVKRSSRSLSFETPNSTIIMDPNDIYVFGAKVDLPSQELSIVEANVMALRVARKFPSCFVNTSVIPSSSSLPGNFYFGSNTIRTGFKSASSFTGVSMTKNSHSVLVDSPMITSLKLTSAIIVSDGGRGGRRLESNKEPITTTTTTTTPPFINSSQNISFFNPTQLLHKSSMPIYGTRVEIVPDVYDPSTLNDFTSAPLFDILTGKPSAAGLLDSTATTAMIVEPFSLLGGSSISSRQSWTSRRRRRLQSLDTPKTSLTILSGPMSINTSTITCSSLWTECYSVIIKNGQKTSSSLSLMATIPNSLVEVSVLVKTTKLSSSLPLVTTMNLYSVLQSSSLLDSGRSREMRIPFTGSSSSNTNLQSSSYMSTSGSTLAIFKSCETSYSSLGSNASIIIELTDINTLGEVDDDIKVEISFDLSNPPICPSYFWSTSPWSSCDNTDCASLDGIMTRTVWCESSNGEIVTPSSATCKDDSIPTNTTSCVRSNTCTAPTRTSITRGSKSVNVDVMSYIARVIPSGGLYGSPIEVPALVAGAWSYNYATDTSWRQSLTPSATSMCLEASLQPISLYSAGCGYHQLIGVYYCQNIATTCFETYPSGTSRCNCYKNAIKCILPYICDEGIYKKASSLTTKWASEYLAGNLTDGCFESLPSRDSSPIEQHVIGSFIGTYQVLLSKSSASSGSTAIQDWFNTTSNTILTGNLIASANGTSVQKVYIPLQLSKFTSPTTLTLNSISIIFRPIADFQMSVKIQPLRWDIATSLVVGSFSLSESIIRSGGASYFINVQCDTYIANAFMQSGSSSSSSVDINGFIVSAFSSNISPSIEPFGWKSTVIPFFKSRQAPVSVTYMNETTIQIILPPIPLYRLTQTSEEISIEIPGRYLASGLSQILSASKITIQQTSQNCQVSQWSDIQGQGQGVLSHSIPQIFKRSRSILTAQSGFGDNCPALVQNATILATGFDGNCAFLPCNNGICIKNSYSSMQSTCACAAGFFSPNCTRWGKHDPTISDETWRSSHISVSSWSSCAPTQCLPSIVLSSHSIRSSTCLLSSLDNTCGLSLSSTSLPILSRTCPSTSPAISVYTLPLTLTSESYKRFFTYTGWRVKTAIQDEFLNRFLTFFNNGLTTSRIIKIDLINTEIAILTFEWYGTLTSPYTDFSTMFTLLQNTLTDWIEKMISYSTSKTSSSDIFLNTFGLFPTNRTILALYTNATVFSTIDCSGNGISHVDFNSLLLPTPSSTVTPSVSPSITPTISVFLATI